MLAAIFGIEDVSTLDKCKYQIIVDLVISSRVNMLLKTQGITEIILEIHRIF